MVNLHKDLLGLVRFKATRAVDDLKGPQGTIVTQLE